MGRLIDADALIENMWKIVPSTDYYEFASQICNAIRNQQTAYDVEKVVAELEKAECHIIGQHYFEDGIAKAIDIVKRGGVE
jgi:hypothetical protein